MGPGDAARAEAEDHQRDTKLLREVFAGEKVRTGADEAALDPIAVDGVIGDRDLLAAVQTFQGGRLSRERDSGRRFASGTAISDVRHASAL
jgi:hypothetical protein